MAGLPDMIGSHTGTQDKISHFRKFTCDGCWPIHRGCYAVGYNLRVQLIQPLRVPIAAMLWADGTCTFLTL